MPIDLAIQPFREPRGFIKILQWFFAICAFATAVNFSTRFGFTLKCPNSPALVVNVSLTVEYPYALDTKEYDLPQGCYNGHTSIYFLGNGESDSSYFVAVGVISFLYSMVAIAVYLMFEKVYQSNNKVPLVDFGMTLLLSILWISSFAAFAHTVSSISDASSPKVVCMHNKVNENCSNFIEASYSKLVVSVLFGVINFVLWAGNLWFLYKETTWFESIMKNAMTSQHPSASGSP